MSGRGRGAPARSGVVTMAVEPFHLLPFGPGIVPLRKEVEGEDSTAGAGLWTSRFP